MKRIVLLVVAAVCLASLAGAGAAQSTEEVTVTVHVVDDAGNAVGDASVTASWEGGEATGTTASNGQTLIDVPKGADVSVTVDHADYVLNNPARLGTVSDHTTRTVEVHAPTDGEITVTEDGEPVADATVTLTKAGDDRAAATGTTASDGVLAVESVEAGVYDVTVRKSGYYEQSTTVDLASTDSTTVDVEPGTAEVTFAVTDGILEQPLEVDVTILHDGKRDATLSTNEKGKRSIDLRVNTKYTVRIEGDGYGTHERQLTVDETDTSRSYRIERTPALTLETANERVLLDETVGVTVTDEYGEPVEGATVRVDGSSAATTNAEGTAAVPVETAGELELTAEADGTTSSPVVVEGVDPNGEGSNDDEGSDDESSSSETAADDGMPGFGSPAAVVAIAALIVGLVVRRH
ncbi:carboxypeptidase regulatory-like domain-containing protein [Natrinema sp. 1APR25-10V2]|uniref:carboxypeptidase-like regulatory domain-containing protein n=1 Tax=Natrinema sp. 1APR25-10V2 TaxID=2951081 RepID=UPI002875B4FE|nr:carboxypeptidase regulatory-like domain-containing protein [Natrinema sp. 1APR25-10V2]MDS0475839.1 carboxypeptidase-like regulatory domain-containing protein [Natrinema sp. 1APR25-10V2]